MDFLKFLTQLSVVLLDVIFPPFPQPLAACCSASTLDTIKRLLDHLYLQSL